MVFSSEVWRRARATRPTAASAAAGRASGGGFGFCSQRSLRLLVGFKKEHGQRRSCADCELCVACTQPLGTSILAVARPIQAAEFCEAVDDNSRSEDSR